jgi:hypothetical protein
MWRSTSVEANLAGWASSRSGLRFSAIMSLASARRIFDRSRKSLRFLLCPERLIHGGSPLQNASVGLHFLLEGSSAVHACQSELPAANVPADERFPNAYTNFSDEVWRFRGR